MKKIIQDRNRRLLVDVSDNRITLLDGRFYYTDEKEPRPIPSVTTILDCYPKGPAYFEWLKTVGKDADMIMHDAGKRGSTVHNLTERYDKGEKISLVDENMNLQMSMIEWSMFERYVDFNTRFQPKHDFIENNLVSTKLNCAGTVDRMRTWINGKSYLIDIKTSPQIYDHFWVQLAAYDRMAMETGVKNDELAILHLNAKIRTENPKEIQGIGWKLYTMPNKRDYYFDLFSATQKLWYCQNGDSVPQAKTYQLNHQMKPVKKTKK